MCLNILVSSHNSLKGNDYNSESPFFFFLDLHRKVKTICTLVIKGLFLPKCRCSIWPSRSFCMLTASWQFMHFLLFLFLRSQVPFSRVPFGGVFCFFILFHWGLEEECSQYSQYSCHTQAIPVSMAREDKPFFLFPFKKIRKGLRYRPNWGQMLTPHPIIEGQLLRSQEHGNSHSNGWSSFQKQKEDEILNTLETCNKVFVSLHVGVMSYDDITSCRHDYTQ